MRVLDLFSGIGGFSLGLERTGGFRTVAFCECEPFCRRVLAKHWPGVPIFPDVRELTVEALADTDQPGCEAQRSGAKWARTGDEAVLCGAAAERTGASILPIDVVVGGYPCQPFSLAGQRRGQADDRHLWPEMYRLVAAIRPAWVVGENVAGHIGMGLDDVLSDLAGLGYAVQPFVVPACAVDAPHRRDRVWIVAAADDADRNGQRSYRTREHQQRDAESADRQERVARPVREVLARPGDAGIGHPADVANPTRHEPRRQDQRAERERAGAGGEPVIVADHAKRRRGLPSAEVSATRSQGTHRGRGCGELGANADDAGLALGEGIAGDDGPEQPAVERACRWLPEPGVGRVAHGVPHRVDRLRALGNAVVPQVVEMIGRAILAAERAAA